MTARIVVHVGLPKTGSKTLQYELFPSLPGVVLLGANGVVSADPLLAAAGRKLVFAVRRAAPQIAAGHPWGAPGEDALLREAARRILTLDATVVLSEERWTGTAIETDWAPATHVPAALTALFGDAWSAVVVLRDPIAQIASWLPFNMQKRPILARRPDGTLTLAGPAAALAWHFAGRKDDPRSIFRTGARFNEIVALYRRALPPERLHVLAYERLFETADSCRRTFAALLGVSPEGPPLGRRNATTDDVLRKIGARFPAYVQSPDAFALRWRNARTVVASHAGVARFVERHSLPVWRAVMEGHTPPPP